MGGEGLAGPPLRGSGGGAVLTGSLTRLDTYFRKWAGRGGHLGKSCLIGWDQKLPPLPRPLQGVCAEAGPGAGGE